VSEVETFVGEFRQPLGWTEFMRHLADGMTADELVDVIEKPWKWHSEYVEWLVEQPVAA
jgi:hypothetical protein